MSLTIALRSALTSLQVTQSQLQVASNNIANVNTPGYTRKTQLSSSVILDGRGAGVRAANIERTVDTLLLRQVRDQFSRSSQWDVRDNFLQTVQDMFGTPGDNTSIAHGVTDLGTSLANLAVQPESPGRASDVVSRAQLMAQQLNQLSRNLQLQRAQADQEIANTVDDINHKLDRIADLNSQVTHARSLGQPTADLEDERDRLVKGIAEQMDVRTFERGNGEMAVMTASGRRLVDGSQIQNLSHTSAANLGSNATYIAPSATGLYNTGGISGIYIGPPDTTNGTNDITSEIGDGRLKALIDMRDRMLAGNQSSLDELAAKLRDRVNAEHNNGAAFPPPSLLSGTQNMAGTDAFSGSGSVRIALVDPATGAVGNVADINLAGLTTVNQVITAINTAGGLGGNATASLVNGKLTLSTGNGTGIVINENTSSVAVGADARGFSHYFGLNDMFVSGTNYAAYDSNVQTDASAALNLTGPMTFTFGASTVNIAVAATDSLIDLTQAINADATLTAAGIRAALVTDASGSRLRITDSGGDNFLLSSAGNAVSNLGMTVQRVGAAGQFAVRPTLVSNPNLLTRGDVSMTAVVGSVEIGSGDGTAAQRLADAFAASQTWAANGNDLPALNDTFAAFATMVLSRNATQAAEATEQLNFNQSLYQQIDTRLQSDSAVNLDEELAQLTILQNAYAAAARVVNVASELFDQLNSLIR